MNIVSTWALPLSLLWLVFVCGNEKATCEPAVVPELRSELLRRANADQEARTALSAWLKAHSGGATLDLDALPAHEKETYQKLAGAVQKVDNENMKWLSQIVDKHDWPVISLVGMDGSQAAWLLIQHADGDPKLQRKCLNIMAKQPKEEVSQSHLAYLTDRVLLAEGKKQIYGTQFIASDNGKWKPRPLKDPANVDKRRADIGLSPLAEYIKELETVYGRPIEKRTQEAEQGGAEQPATDPKSKSEGKEMPKPKSEARSR